MAKIIIIGNEKGGSGKTTTAMHLIVSLMKLGFSVASLDLDSRQQSLTRYVDNRKASKEKLADADMQVPDHRCVVLSNPTSQEEADSKFKAAVADLSGNDFIVVDTPGSDSPLSRSAHYNADMIVTPINDSFVDLDLIGVISADTLDSIKPGIYSALIWEAKMRLAAEKRELAWVVVRNRLSTLDAKNKRNVETSLNKLAKRFGFKVAPGFGDRVIFKELFLMGLTLLDAKQIKLSTSAIAARQELRDFVQSLDIPEINNRTQEQSLKAA